jgi:hypothetical protein
VKPKKGITVAVWVLLGILAISAGSLSLATNESSSFPSAGSYSPSGTRAFADLLRAQGYSVAVTTSTKPHLTKNDVVVAFKVGDNDDDPIVKKAFETITAHEADGGSAAIFDLKKDFNASSTSAYNSQIDIGGPINPKPAKISYDVTVDGRTYMDWSVRAADSITLAEFTAGDNPVAVLYKEDGKGPRMEMSSGLIATNRFIDKNDNAVEAVRLIRAVAPPKSNIVFMESSFGNGSEPGILDTIGGWAVAAWWQILLLFVVIVVTLGVPFGYAEEIRVAQRGARELIDAVAQTYRRSRMTHLALKSMYDDADRTIRRKLKLPVDAPRSERDRLIPDELVRALASVEISTLERIGNYEALGLARRLDKQLAAFLGEHLRPRRKAKYG